MLMSKLFLKRFITLSLILNSPPIIVPIFSYLGIEPFALIVTLLIWANMPLQLGLASLFDSSQIEYAEFGVKDASVEVILAIVVFWILLAAAVTSIYTLLSHKKGV